MKNLLLMLIIISLFVACGDDDSSSTTTPAKSKTELLTNGKWKFQSGTIDPAIDMNGTDVTDFFELLDDCDEDDLLNYKADGTFAHEEGATVCDTSSSPGDIYDTGMWTWNSDETMITETSDSGDVQEITVISLTESQMQASVVEQFDTTGTDYTITVVLVRP